MGIDEAMDSMSSRQFLIWKVHLEEERYRTKVDHWYLARIAMEVVQARTKKRLNIKQFILPFKKDHKAPVVKRPMSKRRKALALATSKAFWMSLAGFGVRTPPDAKKKEEPDVK